MYCYIMSAIALFYYEWYNHWTWYNAQSSLILDKLITLELYKRYTFVCCAVQLFPIAFSYTDVYKNGIVQQRIWYSELGCIHKRPGAPDPSFSVFVLIKHMPPWRRNIVPRKYHVTIFKRGWDNNWFTYVRYELHLMII